MSARYEVVNRGTIYEEPGHNVVAICCDPAWADRIAALLNNGNGKPKPKRKKAASSEAMSPGGAAWGEACRRGRTYDAMDLDKIRERAANICSRQEGKPGAPPNWSRYYLKYGPLANEAMVELSKLGVPGHLITMQTREEWELQQRTERYEMARNSLKRHIPALPQFLQLEQVDNVIAYGRTVARELLAAGERNEAADLARYVRCVERMVRERWPSEYKRARPTREEAVAV